MEMIVPFTGTLRRHWRRRRGYNRLSSPPNRRNLKVAKLGGAGQTTKRPIWRRLGRKQLRLMRLVSPMRLWRKLKNAYMNMMMGLGGTNTEVFGNKRIPKARDGRPTAYSRTEFENRLVFEIYKSMVSSLELGYTSKLSS